MRLDGQDVVLFLAEEGRSTLQAAGFNLPASAGLGVSVEVNDELGIWIRVQRDQDEHLLLVRWHYVLTLDIVPARRAPIGLSS